MQKELTDKIIKLKRFRVEDASPHLVGEDKAAIKWLSGGKGTLKGIQNWIRKNERYWSNNGPVFNFAIWTVADDQLVGMVEANKDWRKIEGLEEGDANISYGIYPKARRRGYASRAVNLITEFLKGEGTKRAIIRVSPDNIDSLKVPKRCGFTRGEVIELKDGKLIMFRKNL